MKLGSTARLTVNIIRTGDTSFDLKVLNRVLEYFCLPQMGFIVDVRELIQTDRDGTTEIPLTFF
ncbi:hypothetical protein COT97_03175 [Candidatus Falkowbacteria bacterium CG10_big_fil_rev_8_21_14_0_10_39_11]|uniref:Uncharacterized protein n=1 Tax=Candidatus Falkowbacteria bacterium CG10_big_fil_rev_8_21_14_0_10_39_11 TaxID=1974565 RepID=A0A2H0V4T3_9BACT|nr:MAG: hypothetical protein COT97_03175 [Candidatus Falkowbacteria bacterium CG10_big_fil_rev_8_21_14_0_10_39_11]